MSSNTHNAVHWNDKLIHKIGPDNINYMYQQTPELQKGKKYSKLEQLITSER